MIRELAEPKRVKPIILFFPVRISQNMLGAGGRSSRATLSRVHARASATTANSSVVAWHAVRGADTYEITVTPTASVLWDDETTVRLTDLRPDSTYTVSLRAKSADAKGPWNTCEVHTLLQELQQMHCTTALLHPICHGRCMDHLLQVSDAAYGCLDECGVDVSGVRYRFGVFYAGQMANVTGALITLHGARGAWTLLPDQTVRHFVIHISVADGPWLDANKLFIPCTQGELADGWACGRPSNSCTARPITFGGRCLSGEAIVRVGLPCDERRLCGVEVSSVHGLTA